MEGQETVEIQPVAAGKERSKIIKLVLAATLLVTLFGGSWWWYNLHNYVNTDNAKVAGDIIDVSPKISGRLEVLHIKEGDSVEAGQVMAELDNAQLKINLLQAEATLALCQANYDKLPDDLKANQADVDKAGQNVTAALAQLKAAQISAADAQRTLQQNQELHQAGAISEEALTAATSAYSKAQAAVDAANASVQANQAALQNAQAKFSSLDKTGAAIYQAQLEQAHATYETAQLNLDNSVVKAPTSGTVVRVAVQVGENVSAGQTVISLSDLNLTWISANIEENKFDRLRVGQTVSIQVDAYPGADFKGQVVELGGASQSTFALIPTENSSGNYTKVTQRFNCKIAVDKPERVLKPGMSAAVKIHTGS